MVHRCSEGRQPVSSNNIVCNFVQPKDGSDNMYIRAHTTVFIVCTALCKHYVPMNLMPHYPPYWAVDGECMEG